MKLEDSVKYCGTCKVVLYRKRYNGRLEDRSVFLRRRYCSLSCANTRENLSKHGKLSRARKWLKGGCEACGEKRKIVIHHIDQNLDNNDPKNLQTLCKYCHDFWHSMARRRCKTVAGKMPCLGSQPASRIELTG